MRCKIRHPERRHRLQSPSSPCLLQQTSQSHHFSTEKLIKALTRLDDIEKSGSESGLDVLQLVKDIASEELLQQRLAVGSILQLLEASFQFLVNGGVNHLGALENSEWNLITIKAKTHNNKKKQTLISSQNSTISKTLAVLPEF